MRLVLPSSTGFNAPENSMNRLPLTTTIISVVVAVSLWLLATWLESDSPWLEPDPASVGGIAEVQVRSDTPVEVNPDAADCDQAEGALRARVDAAQTCSSDDDCTLFDYGYPIECLTSVAKSDITALRLEYRKYEQSCAYRVYYDCPTGDMERQAVCRSNRCTVELKSTKMLEEKTLDYLGLDPK
jgi:hypothetical protein